ncbi:RNA polymerase sigma factor [Hugenholtzia roseola]|uniref:RNA polymerase sigma factor n=1 Tax=Hugenholtzia roseola TaxID=1002 RepID=UPI000409A3EC|nr:sigma-70 family RNA polymerase sigma factor [Hugenholtzia roseola]
MRQLESHIEEELIAGCVAGKRQAQAQLYQLFAPKMYAIALRYSKTTHEADDILQEAFLKVFQKIESFGRECPLGYWIKKIVINTALKQNRRKIDQAIKEEVEDLQIPQGGESIQSSYNFQDLLRMVQRLAPSYQTIFNLYAIEGYKHSEIAEMLGISEGTSKSQYSRARAILQDMILKEQQRYEQLG